MSAANVSSSSSGRCGDKRDLKTEINKAEIPDSQTDQIDLLETRIADRVIKIDHHVTKTDHHVIRIVHPAIQTSRTTRLMQQTGQEEAIHLIKEELVDLDQKVVSHHLRMLDPIRLPKIDR